jgi:hypothetical protein
MDREASRRTATMSQSYVAEVNDQADDETVAREGEAGFLQRYGVRKRDGEQLASIGDWTASAG